MKRIRINIYGRVQGVSYRFEARTMARYIGVKGFVKNMYDGSVYIEAEGKEGALQDYIAWCRRGPDAARVENIEIQDIPLSNDKSFNIRY